MEGSAIQIHSGHGIGPDNDNTVAHCVSENRGYDGVAGGRMDATTLLSLGLAMAAVLCASRAFAGTPVFSHVFIVVEENHSYSQVVGNPSMPYLNMLIANGGLATQYFANTHPSLPDYSWLTSGGTSGVTTCPATTTADNVVRHFVAQAISWHAYVEDLPSVGFLGCSVHHDPFIYYSDVQNSPTQRQNIVPFSYLATDIANNTLPRYSFIVPNPCNDAHDCALSVADQWLSTNIAPLLNSDMFQPGGDGVLIITFDEGTDNTNGGGQVAWVIIGPNVKQGYQSTTLYQHQSTLRLMMEGVGATSFPQAAATASDMAEFFGATTSTPSPAPTPTPNATPSPTPTHVPTATATATATPTPATTPSPTPTSITTLSPTPSPAPTPVPTAATTPSPTPTSITTLSPTPSPAPTPVPTASPTLSATPSPTPILPLALVQQSTTAANRVASCALPAITVTSGNTLILALGWNPGVGNPSLSSVADSNGGAWQSATIQSSGTQARMQIWYSLNHPGGSTIVTATYSGNVSGVAADLSEWSGIAPSSGFDASAGTTGNSSTLRTGVVTATHANVLVIGATVQQSKNTIVSGPTNSFTGLAHAVTSASSGNASTQSAYQIESAVGAYSTGWTMSGNSAWAGSIASFHQ